MLKYSNFKFVAYVPQEGIKTNYQYATVDVTDTGCWPFRKPVTVTMDIFYTYLSWRFTDTGEYCPGEVDDLYEAWKARQLLESHYSSKKTENWPAETGPKN